MRLQNAIPTCLLCCLGFLASCEHSSSALQHGNAAALHTTVIDSRKPVIDKEANNNFMTSVTTKSKADTSASGRLVAITSVSFNGEQIKAGVMSTGCTSSNDFIATHEILEGACLVSVHRIKADLCRRAPFVTDISIDWSMPDACAASDLIVTNPMLITAEDGHLTKHLK